MEFFYSIELESGEEVDVKFNITHFVDVKPNSLADNPWDYHGYTEIEFDQVSHLDNPEVVKIVEDKLGDIEECAFEAVSEYNNDWDY